MYLQPKMTQNYPSTLEEKFDLELAFTIYLTQQQLNSSALKPTKKQNVFKRTKDKCYRANVQPGNNAGWLY